MKMNYSTQLIPKGSPMSDEKDEKKELEKIYNAIFRDAVIYEKQYPIQMVAATYMAIAMRLYKTHLTDDEYKKMIQTVLDTEVKPYEPNKKLN
mgnify:FL=1